MTSTCFVTEDPHSRFTSSDKIWEALGPFTKEDLENILFAVQDHLDHWDEIYEDDA